MAITTECSSSTSHVQSDEGHYEMTLRIPTRVFDLTWSEEFVEDWLTGLRSRPGPDSLYKKMDNLLRDQDPALASRKNPRIFAESNFHPAKIARVFLTLFDNMSNDSKVNVI